MLELTEVIGGAFDIAKGLLIGEEAKFTLLKEKGDTEAFEEIAEVTSGWRPKYSEFFGNTTFEVADISEDFATKVRAADHLVITESGVESMNNFIYEMLDDTTAPDADKPYWRIRAKSLGRKYIEGEEI